MHRNSIANGASTSIGLIDKWLKNEEVLNSFAKTEYIKENYFSLHFLFLRSYFHASVHISVAQMAVLWGFKDAFAF